MKDIPALNDQKLLNHLAAEQKRVPWAEEVLLHLQEHLYVVQKGDKRVVKCFCGYEFGDPKTNWKYEALVFDRKPREIHTGITGPDPDWSVYREFYCPGCGVQLDIEAVPHGLPFIFSFEPDI